MPTTLSSILHIYLLFYEMKISALTTTKIKEYNQSLQLSTILNKEKQKIKVVFV